MSLINKEISDFQVTAFIPGKADGFKTITKKDLLGKWSILFFYPADFTFVCPTELEDLAELYEEFKAENCEIYSVSTDSHFVHKAWYDMSETIKKLKYPMLADPTHILSKDFEVLISESGIAERGAFILNPDGKVVSYEISAGGVGRNASEILRRLKASKFVAENGDQVCPARWKQGDKTLKPGIDLVGKI